MSYKGFCKCIFTKDYEGAIIDFQKAQQMFPGAYEMDHSYFFWQAVSYLELNNYVKAQEYFKQDIMIETNGDTTKNAHFNSLFFRCFILWNETLWSGKNLFIKMP